MSVENGMGVFVAKAELIVEGVDRSSGEDRYRVYRVQAPSLESARVQARSLSKRDFRDRKTRVVVKSGGKVERWEGGKRLGSERT